MKMLYTMMWLMLSLGTISMSVAIIGIFRGSWWFLITAAVSLIPFGMAYLFSKEIGEAKESDAFHKQMEDEMNAAMPGVAGATGAFLATNPFLSTYIAEEFGRLTVEDVGTAIEPIVGHREWLVRLDPSINEFRLYSHWGGILWIPFEAHSATCVATRGFSFSPTQYLHLPGHDAPHEGCTCGIYARNDEVDPSFVGGWEGMAVGEVNLWGKVYICESGYRAEYAYPKNLTIFSSAIKTADRVRHEIEQAYGIPVTTACTSVPQIQGA